MRELTTLEWRLHTEIVACGAKQTPLSQEVNYVYNYRESNLS